MKSYPLFITNLSHEDLMAAKNFYDQKSPDLGNYFYDSVISDLDALKFYAGIHQRYLGYYRMLTKRFPYAIYYEIEKDTVVVHAILHTRKDTIYIENRLAGKTT